MFFSLVFQGTSVVWPIVRPSLLISVSVRVHTGASSATACLVTGRGPGNLHMPEIKRENSMYCGDLDISCIMGQVSDEIVTHGIEPVVLGLGWPRPKIAAKSSQSEDGRPEGCVDLWCSRGSGLTMGL